MSDDQYKRIFSRNLRHYMSLNNKEQVDLINDLGLNKSAVSTWCNGTRLPRMDKVDLLAKYFNVTRSDLIEEHGPERNAQRQRSERLLEYYEQLHSAGQDKVLTYTKNLLSLQEAEDAATSATIPFTTQEQPQTIAAHFDGKEYTADESDEIRQFAAFVKNKRK